MADIAIGDHSFYVEKNGESEAYITFTHDNDSNIVIEHTYVAEELGGQGIGKELLANVVEKARAENKKIVPQCSYAEKQLKKHEEYHDVLITV
ncbi:N-acetyltransferase [Salibacterium salarium]|uniref:N-acetyltransferase n=1 Tax=Salibacterium salarium TaxID=284579 RepID=A0A3R9QLI6_9BACI|nr:GNAT family N-acetyltransferase [Salibacterium salarium]RSL33024.1 N-acetyltransferase [Salibacterium salarium]